MKGGKKLMHNSSCERGVAICETNSTTGTKTHEEEGEEGSSGTGEEIPLQSKVKATVKQVVPLQQDIERSMEEEKTSTHPQHLCKEFSDVPQHEGSQQALCACTFNTACKVEERMKAVVRELRCVAS
ncbi:hypothetical protein AV530_012680 [Patagioenas fasciata monilis]|uniref:Uncharacterized protein n=1 Tax=Patagioenas fasciata monilis TaxID=372326 RepID=A0A1V4JBJ7_PATFA|nr:hypothetical protein AV530_012680 [Patagioenas fasciata monilis]